MTILTRLCVATACVTSFACGGGLAADEAEGIGTDGGVAGSGGGSDGGVSGDAGSGGTEPEGPDVLLAEDFEDGDTNDWFRDCARIEALPEAAANETSFGARLVETRGQGCEVGYAGTEIPLPQTPSGVEWWMRSNSRGEIFGSLQVWDAIMVYAADDMVVVYDGEESKVFDIDGSQWHHYELHDIDWINHTYSLTVDGNVQAVYFDFKEPRDAAEAIGIVAAARNISTTGPVSVDVDEIVIFE